MYIIAGLGNPGSKYENTRHNIGWLALDELAKEQGVSVERMKFHALTGQCVLNGEGPPHEAHHVHEQQR